jgi:hypothetical protein
MNTQCLPCFNPYVEIMKGSQGPQGPPGERGPAGGLTGPQGPTGAQGPEGPRGPEGLRGLRGDKGFLGDPGGATGVQGPTGSTGPQGPQGHTGPQGITGVRGPTGAQGITGAQGPDGFRGPQGDPGGPRGNTGPQGATGERGLPGGSTGPQGPTGSQGPTGTRGETGVPYGLNGIYFGDYLYWDGNHWVVGSENVNLGRNAGETGSQSRRVAIGEDAGRNNQGKESIAIGYKAGFTGQVDNSIIINATGVALDASSSGFFVAPVSNRTTDYLVYYDVSTNEITYSSSFQKSIQTEYSIQEIQLIDNNDISWNFIVSIRDKQVLLQMKETTTSTMDSSGSLVLSTLATSYRPLYESRFNGSGYIDITGLGNIDSINYHNLYSIIVKTDGKIEIKNIDNTGFNKNSIITVYPTSFVYHVL